MTEPNQGINQIIIGNIYPAASDQATKDMSDRLVKIERAIFAGEIGGTAAGSDTATIYYGQYLSNAYALTASTGASPTIAVDWSNGNFQTITLGHTGTATITFSNEWAGGRYLLTLIQDGTGSRVVDYTIAGVSWPGGTEPTQGTGANKVDLLTFVCLGAGSFLGTGLTNL